MLYLFVTRLKKFLIDSEWRRLLLEDLLIEDLLIEELLIDELLIEDLLSQWSRMGFLVC